MFFPCVSFCCKMGQKREARLHNLVIATNHLTSDNLLFSSSVDIFTRCLWWEIWTSAVSPDCLPYKYGVVFFQLTILLDCSCENKHRTRHLKSRNQTKWFTEPNDFIHGTKRCYLRNQTKWFSILCFAEMKSDYFHRSKLAEICRRDVVKSCDNF